MTKPELINAVAGATGMRKVDTAKAVDAVFAAIIDSLGSRESVAIAGFGTFDTRTRAARMGRNPRTGAQIKIAKSTACVFRPGKRVKDAIGS